MNPQELDAFISADNELAPHKSYLSSIAKPCIDITLTGGRIQDSTSRFGGVPLVPQGFVWPTHDTGEYLFLGQINFSEISHTQQSLPKTGLLSLFYASDDEGEVFWGDNGYILGYFFPDLEGLTLSPEGNPKSKSKKMTFQEGVSIPLHEELRSDWPFDTDVFYDLRDLKSASEDYLLGYPSHYSLAYDPTPGEDWVSLLTLTSHDELDWCWHDGDKLMIFIEKEKLAKQDFSYLKADAG
jgi:uncharacterized protein YwqG